MITTQAPLIRKDFATGLYTKTELANKYRCHRNTISNILKRNEEKDVYIRKVNIKNPLIMPYRNYIESLLKRGNPTAKAIYYSILDKGANISYSTVVKAVKSIKRELDLAVIRYETSPGMQGQVEPARLRISGFTYIISNFFVPKYHPLDQVVRLDIGKNLLSNTIYVRL